MSKLNKLKLVTVVGTRPEIIRMSQIIAKFDYFFDHYIYSYWSKL